MAKLGDICTMYSGTGFPVQYQGNPTGRYPFYKVGDIAKNVTQGFAELKICENYVDDEVCHTIKGTIIPEKTVVFAKIGEAVKLNRRGITTVPCLIDNNAMGIKPNEDIISLQYFYHFMCNLKLEDYAEATTVPSVKKTIVEKIEIPLPLLETQKQIAANLDKVTHTIDLCNAILEKLDLLVKSRFVEMFGDPVYNSNSLPVKCLGDLGEWTSGGTPSRAINEYFDGSINWYSAGELNSLFLEGSIEKITEEAILNSSAKLFKAGSMLVGMYDTAAFKMGILKEDSASNQACACITPNNSVNIIWLYYELQMMKNHFLSQRRGVRQKNLNLGMIRSFEIPIADIKKQYEFAAFVEQTDKSKLAVKQVLEKAETLKKALMQEYFG